MAGQTFHDRLTAAKHTLSGQSLARAVCKATTEEIIGPKKKHLDYLIHCTNEPNVSVPELCNLLIERTQQSSWVIVFKALITAHHLMCYGNERFVQCMATSSCKFHLSNFVDKTGTHGYEMSTFVRRYAKYLNGKAASYRTMGADFCKMKRGKEEGVLRNMSTETLLKTLPILQEQLDILIEFDCNPDDLSNGVMNSCFMLLYRDLIQLFAVYNDGIINLFEKYFTMNKKHCREALDIYKKFIVVMDKVSDFLKVAESVGIDKGNIPDLTKAPASLLEEMESHLTFLEGKKMHTTTTTVPSRFNSVQSAVSALSSTGSAFTSSISSSDEINGLTFDESMRRAVEEEAAVMNQMKVSFASEGARKARSTAYNMKFSICSPLNEEQKMRELAARKAAAEASKIPSPLPPPSSQPVSPPTKAKEAAQQQQTPTTKQQPSNSAMDDLMAISSTTTTTTTPQPQGYVQVPLNAYAMEGMQATQGFVSEEAFRFAFTASVTSSTGFNTFGQVLQPQSAVSPPPSSPVPEMSESKSSPTSGKLISSDLDSSLQSLVQNLDINDGKKAVRPTGHQWGSPKPQTRTGGTNWSPTSASMTNYRTPQPVQPVPNATVFPTTSVPPGAVYGFQPAVPGIVPQQPYVGVWVQGMPPAGFGVVCPPVQNVAVMQTPPPIGMVVQPSPQRSVTEGMANQTSSSASAGWPAGNDPFGAL